MLDKNKTKIKLLKLYKIQVKRAVFIKPFIYFKTFVYFAL